MRVKKRGPKGGGGVVWLGSAAVLRASVRRPSSLGSGQSEREKQVVHEKNRPPQRCPSSSTAKTAGVHAASNRVAARLQIGFQDVKREKEKKGTQQPPGDRVGVRRRELEFLPTLAPARRHSAPELSASVSWVLSQGKTPASMPPPFADARFRRNLQPNLQPTISHTVALAATSPRSRVHSSYSASTSHPNRQGGMDQSKKRSGPVGDKKSEPSLGRD